MLYVDRAVLPPLGDEVALFLEAYRCQSFGDPAVVPGVTGHSSCTDEELRADHQLILWLSSGSVMPLRSLLDHYSTIATAEPAQCLCGEPGPSEPLAEY